MNNDEIISWLLKGDVAIQYHVYRDLLEIEREDLQERIAHEGWGRQFLNKRNSDGHWGDRFYQPKWISTHYTLLDLHNVISTISDRRTPINAGGTHIDYYEADVTNATLYYPFGMEIKTYQADSNGYRYGFNGMGKDDGIKGSGNSLDFGARIYDSRLGRFLSRGPLEPMQPFQSPYVYAGNEVIWAVDAAGEIKVVVIEYYRDAKNNVPPIDQITFYEGQTGAELQGVNYQGIVYITIYTTNVYKPHPERENYLRSLYKVESYNVEGGNTTHELVYEAGMHIGLLWDAVMNISPMGNIVQGFSGEDFNTGKNLNGFESASMILSGALDIFSAGSSSMVSKIISKGGNMVKVMDIILEESGLSENEYVQLSWTLIKIGKTLTELKSASTTKAISDDVKKRLGLALEAGKGLSDFYGHIYREYSIKKVEYTDKEAVVNAAINSYMFDHHLLNTVKLSSGPICLSPEYKVSNGPTPGLDNYPNKQQVLVPASSQPKTFSWQQWNP